MRVHLLQGALGVCGTGASTRGTYYDTMLYPCTLALGIHEVQADYGV